MKGQHILWLLIYLPFLSWASSPIYYVHSDHLGTPQKLSDDTGTVVWEAEYEPFGGATVDDDPDLDGHAIEFNLRFPGQYYDKYTGANYNYYRDYDPSTGRYLQSDPIGLNGGLNTYGYVLQNPLRYIDPFGLVSSLDSCTGHNAVACAEAGISSRVPGAINTGGVALCFLFGICSANESSEEGECPPVPEDYTGENLRGDGKTNLSGGEKARDRIFGELTGGNHVTDENGHKVAPNGVRSRTGRDGRLRIDIPAPASGNRGPETIHFNP